jgi:hypothetical protein
MRTLPQGMRGIQDKSEIAYERKKVFILITISVNTISNTLSETGVKCLGKNCCSRIVTDVRAARLHLVF